MSSPADVLDLLQLELMEEEFLLQNIAQIVSLKWRLLSGRLRKRNHRYWVHDILKRRLEHGADHNLNPRASTRPRQISRTFQNVAI